MSEEPASDTLKIVADERIPLGWIWFKPARTGLQRIVEKALQRKDPLDPS